MSRDPSPAASDAVSSAPLAKSGGISRRSLLCGGAALGAASSLAYPRHVFAQSEKNHPLAGKSVHMSILGVAGWLPSSLSVDMSPEFAKYAKQRYGYDVSFSFAGAPFGALFQKAATSLATRSQEYNIMISDSQWLGALATPKWIVKLNDIIAHDKELGIEWYAPVIRNAYQVYPDGTNNLWGFPQVGDTESIFVRTDILNGPGEAQAFQAKHGSKLPTTWEDFEKMDLEDWKKLVAFFNRPEKGYHGIAMQYSREYDALSCPLMSFMRSMGGDIWNPEDGSGAGRHGPAGERAGYGSLQIDAEIQPARGHQLFHRRGGGRIHAGQGVLRLAVARDRGDDDPEGAAGQGDGGPPARVQGQVRDAPP